MTEEVGIRPARSDDVEEMYQVIRQSRQAAFEGLLPPAELDWDPTVSDAFREFVGSTISEPKKALFVAVRDEEVIGVAELVWDPGDTGDFVADSEAECKAIHVRPRNWNEGVGTELLEKAVEILQSHLSGIALAVLEDNERARAFYERRGFKQTGTTRRKYGGKTVSEAVYRRSL